jgi:predicted molibdopterin-dependent oxidoreductase YjgC
VLFLDAHAHPWLASDGAAAIIADRQVAVLARYRTPLVDAASIVMPLASWAETDGTYTSSTGRVQLAHNALSPVGQARRAWEIVYRLAIELGIEQERALTTRILFAEMAAEVAAFSGVTWGRLLAEPGMPVHEEVLGVG